MLLIVGTYSRAHLGALLVAFTQRTATGVHLEPVLTEHPALAHAARWWLLTLAQAAAIVVTLVTIATHAAAQCVWTRLTLARLAAIGVPNEAMLTVLAAVGTRACQARWRLLSDVRVGHAETGGTAVSVLHRAVLAKEQTARAPAVVTWRRCNGVGFGSRCATAATQLAATCISLEAVLAVHATEDWRALVTLADIAAVPLHKTVLTLKHALRAVVGFRLPRWRRCVLTLAQLVATRV